MKAVAVAALELQHQQTKDLAWEPKVCAFHLSNPLRILEKFASIQDVPMNLVSLHSLEEVTEKIKYKFYLSKNHQLTSYIILFKSADLHLIIIRIS